MKNKKLFCIPYAGGSANYYRRLSRYLHPTIKLYPIELAGRGTRHDESFYATLNDAVDDIYKIISRDISDEPYCLFGHSMGGLIAYELSLKLAKSKQSMPEHVFLSSIYPPYINDATIINGLSDEDLQEELVKWGGTSSEFFSERTLLLHFLPIIKADLKMLEKYGLKEEVINTETTILWGKEDKEADIMQGWKRIVKGKCNLVEFEGGHFYINNNLKGVAKVINNVIGIS